MPLNDKGKKILASMEKQYGKKKGKTVFYAMENSGKLKGIKQLRRGGSPDEVSGMEAALSNEPGISTYSGKQTSSVNTSGGDGGGNNNVTTTQTGTGSNNNQRSTGFVTTALNVIGKGLDITGLGYMAQLGKKAVQTVQQSARINKMRNEDILGGEMMTTKNMYRPYAPTPNTGGDNTPTQQLCPDGTTPPCKSPVTQIKNPVSTPNPFLSGFKAYDDGGEVVISSNVDKSLL